MTQKTNVVEAQGATEQQKKDTKIANICRLYFGEEIDEKFDEWFYALLRMQTEYLISESPDLDAEKKRFAAEQFTDVTMFLDNLK